MKRNTLKRYFCLLLVFLLTICAVAVSEESSTPIDEAVEELEVTLGQFESNEQPPAGKTDEVITKGIPSQSSVVAAKATTNFVLSGNANATMNIGDQMQIKLSGFEATSWKTSKAKVATVNETGLVTAVAKGKAKITVTTASKKKLKLTLNVIDPYEPSSISFPQGKEITVNVGSTAKLTPSLAPTTAKTTYTWKSGKAKIATVDGNGVVSGIKEGKAKITVTTANKKKATITVIVADPYKPSSVAIAQGSALTLNVGDTITLSPVLAPETARTVLTWKSGKAKVASVGENGTVSALSEGKAKITVSTANKKKATITITVVVPYKPSAVGIAQAGKISLTVGQTIQLTPVLSPETARTTFAWKSSKTKVASVSTDGTVTALAKGTAKITVSTANKKKATITVTVLTAPEVTVPEVTDKDLSSYLGKTVAFVKKEFGVKLDPNILYEWDYTFYGNGFGFTARSQDDNDTIIETIIYDSCDYNILGFTLGMTYAEVDAALNASGWSVISNYIDDYYSFTHVVYTKEYSDHVWRLYFQYKNGITRRVELRNA